MIMQIESSFPVGNAAGWCKSVEEVRKLALSTTQFIVVGSITLKHRDGNPGNTFNNVDLNSLGLPNPGIDKIREIGPEMIQIAHDAGKPIILSIAGFSPTEYATLAEAGREIGFDGIEINLGCPNVADGGKRKPIACFDRNVWEDIVVMVSKKLGKWTQFDPYYQRESSSEYFLSIKISPMSDPLQIEDFASHINGNFSIDAIVTQNTFPNGLLFNKDGSPQIQTPDKTGWAGFAGSAIKPMALGQVNQWRQALDNLGSNIQVWGAGGIQNGQDVQDMFTAGASVVQVGTAYFVGGAKVFGDIASEFANLN